MSTPQQAAHPDNSYSSSPPAPTAPTAGWVVGLRFVPYYPVWSLLIIALNVLMIWALCVYDRDAAAAVG